MGVCAGSYSPPWTIARTDKPSRAGERSTTNSFETAADEDFSGISLASSDVYGVTARTHVAGGPSVAGHDGTFSFEDGQRYGGSIRARAHSPLHRLVTSLAFLVATGVVSTAGGTGTAGAVAVAHCTPKSHLSAKFIAPNGAATMFYFLIAFTNRGTSSCSLSGVPIAQAVDGPSESPVGPTAHYLATGGVPRGTIELRAHGGTAYVEYYVVSASDWTRPKCRPARAKGVVLEPTGVKRFYIPIDRRGATVVCTRIASTAIGPISSTTY
ncbi:MAG: DUF4232 domain-containing protein [Acidimicrobiales bacterium]